MVLQGLFVCYNICCDGVKIGVLGRHARLCLKLKRFFSYSFWEEVFHSGFLVVGRVT